VLDDHTGFRDEVLALLARNGHEAQGVSTAKAAIPLVESGQFDFVFVDYNMPVHDGMWFMKNVKKPRHTKALLVTAHVNRQMINAMFAVGVAGYIIKPFDEEDLLRHLNFHAEPGRTTLSGAVPKSGAHAKTNNQ